MKSSTRTRISSLLLLATALSASAFGGCNLAKSNRNRAQKPSILLVVVDTLRADAVSAYGKADSTTPNIDALAAEGLRYSNAFSPAPWTIPSHVSLFTGVGPEQHRVGISDRVVAPESLVMLAERMREAGYATAAFIENPLVGSQFGMDQGFDHFKARTLAQTFAEVTNPGTSGYDIVKEVEAWQASRDPSKPSFVFVNLWEPHEPYAVREKNPYLPEGASRTQAEAVYQSNMRICDALPPQDEVAILRGLYLGDVASADERFGRIYRARNVSASRNLITIVTADHGEHFGENRLMDHSYTVRSAALHVPLIVDGVEGVSAAEIKDPVTLMDVTASVLRWAQVESSDGIQGQPLPQTPNSNPARRSLMALYKDIAPQDWPIEKVDGDGTDDEIRAHCGKQDPVFGEMSALIRYPYKLNSYARYKPQLFDLSVDPEERNDLSLEHPELVRELQSETMARTGNGASFVASGKVELDSGAREALRALGYDH